MKAAVCRSEATREIALLLGGGGGRQFGVTFSQGFSLQVDAVGVVDEAVENGVGEGGFANDLVPWPMNPILIP